MAAGCMSAGRVGTVSRTGCSFAGDTGYPPDSKMLAQRFGGFDCSMIPVGCHEPRGFPGAMHADEEEAARATAWPRTRSCCSGWGDTRAEETQW
jgi:L-ascorbate metabolism protein UlaG (beta-lactamase superfamily)